ncbi:hypothetical protein FRB91_003516 [Serendipita sp. 411]|nr:hypothetical protein FRB91_003516 [Serendipita sp. 411]
MPFTTRTSRRGSRPLLARWRHGLAASGPTSSLAPSSSTSNGERKSVSKKARALMGILQRIPLFTHIVMLGLALYGPTQGQYYVAFVFFTLHIVLVSSQLRTAYGMIRCLYLIRVHNRTNWWNYYVEHAKNAHPSALETHHTPRTLPHLIVIPSYKETMATLSQTLSILASHPLAKATYKVCLAMEEREAGARGKGDSLRAQFQDQFLDISVSMHPAGLPGEVPGKGSNVGWGARWLVEREFMLADFDDDDDDSRSTTIPDGILTVMDADTAFSSDYFLTAAVKYLLQTPETRERMMFVPPIIFDRNQADVPGITRITDIMWSAVGIGGIYPSSLVKVPTSAYSVSIGLAVYVGFWDTGPEAIGEDMHMFCKSLLDTRGHLHVETVYAPASQCNVIGPRPQFGTQTKWARFFGDSHARWTQGVRHLWGSLDLFKGTYVFSTPKADFWNWSVIESRWSWKDKDRVLNTAIELSWRLGVLGALCTVVIWIYHDRYHMEACQRWTRQNPTVASKSSEKEKNIETFGADNIADFDPFDLGLRPSIFSERKLPGCLYEYVAMPGGLIFGAIPLLYSHFWHLWTDKLAYTVSAKPTVGPIPVKELRE